MVVKWDCENVDQKGTIGTRPTFKHPQKYTFGPHFPQLVPSLSVFTDILTAPLFINILVHLLAQAHVFHQDKWFLVMDNDPKHTAKVSKAWMSNKIHGKRLDWPSQSPDVNPIENLFGWIKNELMKRGPRTIPSFKHELEEFYKHQ